MRLNNLKNGANNAHDPESIERVEALLKQAADFEPDIQPVDDFVAQALKRRSRFRMGSSRPIALGATGLAGMAAAFVLVMLTSRHEMIIPSIAPPMPANGPSTADGTQAKGTPVPGSNPASTGQNNLGDQRNTPKVDTGAQERSRIQNAGFETRSNRRRDSARPAQRVPKVRWENEVVQRYDRGVMAPTYVEEQGHNGEVEYHPVMVPVATETGARPILIDGGPDVTFSLTNSPEETSHK